MSKRLFVGCLPFIYTDAALAALFKEFGGVVHAQMVWDKKHKRTRGFGFVELASDEAGAEAMEKLKGTKVEDKEIWITPAKPRPPEPPATSGPKTFPFRRPEGGRPAGGFDKRPPRAFDRPRRPSSRDDRPSAGFGKTRRPFPRREGGPPSSGFGAPRRDPNSIFGGPRSGGSDRPSFGGAGRKPFGRPPAPYDRKASPGGRPEGSRFGRPSGPGGRSGGSRFGKPSGPGGRSGGSRFGKPSGPGGRSGGSRFGRPSGPPRGRTERRPGP